MYTAPVVSVALQPIMARAQGALERGDAVRATHYLGQALRSAAITRDDELSIRATLAEAWLLQDDIDQASAALGRPPDTLRETVLPVLLSHLWRLHGRIASARGDQSRAIALNGRALRHAEQAHDPRAIGLAHFELARCYKQLGETATMQEHFAQAASALHAVGDRRNLALVHSLSGSALAQTGHYDEALTDMRQAERLASAVHADDVLAIVCGNQANVAMMRHRYDQALALAERSVTLHEQFPPGHGLAVALATLGQICIHLGALARAETLLQRALEVRRPLLFHETTGAIFDSLAQIHLIRGDYDRTAECLRNARDAYGSYGQQTPPWYSWSLRLLEARLFKRRGMLDAAVQEADAIVEAPGVPPADMLHAHLIAADALLAAGRQQEAGKRVVLAGGTLDARTMPGAWGEFLRVRAEWHAQMSRPGDAYHDLAQSGSVFELLGHQYEAARTHLVLGRLAAHAGARSLGKRYLDQAAATFASLAAAKDLAEVESARALLAAPGTGEFIGASIDADEAVVRRLVDAAALPELLAREVVSAVHETLRGEAVVLFSRPAAGGEPRVLWQVGCEEDGARALARSASQPDPPSGTLVLEGLGTEWDGRRAIVVAGPRLAGHLSDRRLRMIVAVAGQGFELCAARERPLRAAEMQASRPLEPLLPGFLCASTAMQRVVDHITRLQGNDLTVLVTGESGTGKELVARAIHVGSPRSTAMFLPYNCTTTTRELADSQLFGHRRGSFTGAVSDQPGLLRSAAGGTLFLDEIGDLPVDVQPKLLRFLEQGEIMPVGETRPQRVDVRVIAATNADLEQRVSEGKFREDLYYRLSVIRIRVPPLRERREEIPHLASFFLREACERFGKPDVQLSAGVLDLFAQYLWPGNVRQLRNEIQRAVALSVPGNAVTVEHLSPEISQIDSSGVLAARPRRAPPVSLAAAVEEVERELIGRTLDRTRGNISETARVLGLTRRGLYLKLRRLGLEQQVDLDTN